MSASMPSLPVVAIADLASPAELFRCAHFHNAILSAGACLSRQAARKTVRTGSGGKVHQKEIVPEAYKYCASGECVQGAAVKARLADYVPPPSAQARMAERRRAQGVAEVSRIEQQIAAKVASGELRLPDPLPPAIAEDLAADLADAAQRAERDRVAAAVEEVRPEVAARSAEVRKGWDEFRARKDAGRASKPVEPVRRSEPHPLSARGMSEAKEEEDVTRNRCKFEGCGYALRSDNTKGLCGWHTNGRATPRPVGWKAPGKAGAPARKPAQRKNGAPAQPTPAQPIVHGGLLQAQPADLIELLEQRRAHHLAEAERCGLALKALRGAA